MEKINIQDNSGDKKYFTIIPNYIANHSTANDQALYFQMKKITGEQEAICYASEKYFKDKLKIGSKALKKSFQYLLEHKWIEDAGIQEISTKGGVQKTNVYLVKDIWKLNIEYYQGVSESEPLNNKGVFKRKQRGVQKETKGVAFEQQRITYNNNLEEDITARAETIFENGEKGVCEGEGNNSLPLSFPPSQTKKPNKVWELMEWAETRRGKQFVNRGKQLKAIKRLKEAKFTITAVKNRWCEMEEDKFWGNKGFDFADLANNFDKRI